MIPTPHQFPVRQPSPQPSHLCPYLCPKDKEVLQPQLQQSSGELLWGLPQPHLHHVLLHLLQFLSGFLLGLLLLRAGHLTHKGPKQEQRAANYLKDKGT